MNKKKIGKIIGLIIFPIIVFGITYLVTYYVDKYTNLGTAKISVTYDDNDYFIIENTNKLDKENALLEWPYMFSISNTGNKAGIYQIIIEDDKDNDLKRDNLSYSLYLDEKEVSFGKLSKIVDNVLYKNTIKNEVEQKYKLYIYKDSDNDSKVYKYKITLNAILEGGPGF